MYDLYMYVIYLNKICLNYTLYDKHDASGGRSVYQSPVPIWGSIVNLPFEPRPSYTRNYVYSTVHNVCSTVKIGPIYAVRN